MANVIYNEYKMGVVSGLSAAIADGADNVYVMLLKNDGENNYSPSANHNFSEISAFEITGTGYDIEGKKINNIAVALEGNNVSLKGDDVEWELSTIKATGALVYIKGVTENIPVVYVDFGGEKESSTGTFKIIWSNEGIIKYRQSVN